MALHSSNAFFFDRRQLIRLKTKAVRSGAWFKTLQRIDRVLFDLTIRVVGNIRSAKLARSIDVLAKKLEDAIKGRFSSHLMEIGFPMAQRISFTAEKLGNLLAKSWASDRSFAFFLTVMYVNAVNSQKKGNYA